MRVGNLDSQFVVGFFSAFLLLAGLALLSDAAAWLSTDPQPLRSFFEFVFAPRFSILDVVSGLVAVQVLFVVVTAPRWLPRP
jgi:hypothetical protein